MIEVWKEEAVTLAMELYDSARTGLTRREREKEAVARLVEQLLGEGVTVAHDADGAPRLQGAPGFISISHCSEGAVVAYSASTPIGVDIETLRDQLERVKERFLSAGELDVYATPSLLLRAWTAKEALYKAALTRGLPLIEGIRLPLSPGDDTAIAAGRRFTLTFSQPSPSLCLCLALPANK